ncbi:NRDE family protein [Idiomarina tyrosinivorans]|nr:NRDE family protein [Idiomarina tyrosinivorans]
MCVVFIALQQHPEYPLVVLANRDEFHQRPSAAMRWRKWGQQPILAGLDEQGGGTWLGVTPAGRLAILTNFRDPQAFREDAPSRGHWVTTALQQSEQQLQQQLQSSADDYNPFNLLFSDGHRVTTFHSPEKHTQTLAKGVHALSNANLNTPWPKAVVGTTQLRQLMAQPQLTTEELLAVLTNDVRAELEQLPNTGVGQQLEHFLSPIFIRGEDYGTRCSTVIKFRRDGMLSVTERRFAALGKPLGEHHFRWKIRATDAQRI